MSTRRIDKDLSQWYFRWHAVIRHALSSRLRRAVDVDDLAQEVYLRLLRVPRPDLIRHPQSYLYRVAINVAEEWRQRAQQALDHGSEALDTLVSDANPEHDTREAQRDVAVRRALDGLPQSVRTALVLHTRDGLTYEEVAQRMNVSRRAVKRYVANGYAALREQLTDFRDDAPVQRNQGHVRK